MSASTAVPAREPRTPPSGGRPAAHPNWTRRGLLLALAVAFLAAVLTIDASWSNLGSGPGRLLDIAIRMFLPPDWAYAGRAAEGMLESIQIAWVGTVIGAALSLPLALLAAKNVTGTAASSAARQVLNGLRAFPELVLAIIFVTMVGLGAVAGALAIGLHSIGTLGKLGSEAVEGIDAGPLEAADAVGATWLQKMRWGVLPQAMPEIVAFWLYRFEINIRASAILGVIGAGGIGTILSNTVSYRRWDKAGMTLIVVVVATLAIDAVSGRIRRRIIAGATGDIGEADSVGPAGATAVA